MGEDSQKAKKPENAPAPPQLPASQEYKEHPKPVSGCTDPWLRVM